MIFRADVDGCDCNMLYVGCHKFLVLLDLLGTVLLQNKKQKYCTFLFFSSINTHLIGCLNEPGRKRTQDLSVCVSVVTRSTIKGYEPGRIHYLLSIGLLLMLTREAIKDFHLTIP